MTKRRSKHEIIIDRIEKLADSCDVGGRIDIRKYLTAMSKNVPFGQGAFIKGNILIIGEQSAKPPLHPTGQDPFCGMKGCSLWLNKQLNKYRVNEDKLFWINALNLDGTKADVVKIVTLLKPSKIIALGNVADNLCKENNLMCIKIPHPAYWRRFHSKKKYSLIAEVI